MPPVNKKFGDYDEITTLPDNGMVLTDPSNNGQYKRIRKSNLLGSGGGGGGPVTLTPPSLGASGLDADTIRLAIGAVSNELGIEIQRSNDGSTGWATIATAPVDALQYDDNGLPALTTRHYRARSVGNGTTFLTSGWSAVASASTTAGGSSYDSDAEAFFTANGISDVPTMNFLNDKFLELKSSGVWPKLIMLRTYIGANANIYRSNWKSPASLSTLVGVIDTDYTAGAGGFISLGTGYVNHNLNPSVIFPDWATKASMGYYSAANDPTGNKANMGVIIGSNRFWHAAPWAGSGVESAIGVPGTGTLTVLSTPNNGFFLAVRRPDAGVSGTQFQIYRNGVSQGSNLEPAGGPAPNGNVYSSCINFDGVADFFSTLPFRVHYLGLDLTDGESVALSNIIASIATFFSW